MGESLCSVRVNCITPTEALGWQHLSLSRSPNVVIKYISSEEVPRPLEHSGGKAILQGSFHPGGLISSLRPVPHSEKGLYPCKKGKSWMFGVLQKRSLARTEALRRQGTLNSLRTLCQGFIISIVKILGII